MAGKNGSTWHHDWVPANAQAALLKTHGRSSSFTAPSAKPGTPSRKAPAPRKSGTPVVLKTHDHGGGFGMVTAHDSKSGKQVGYIDYFKPVDAAPRIMHVDVDPARQRQGIGTQLYKRARTTAGGKLEHSKNRTDAGNAFAKATGGVVPPRSPYRGR